MIHTGRKSARKGAEGERELAGVLASAGYPVQRGGTQSFGQRPDLFGLEGVHCEVKRCERLSLPAWVAQAERAAVPGVVECLP